MKIYFSVCLKLTGFAGCMGDMTHAVWAIHPVHTHLNRTRYRTRKKLIRREAEYVITGYETPFLSWYLFASARFLNAHDQARTYHDLSGQGAARR